MAESDDFIGEEGVVPPGPGPRDRSRGPRDHAPLSPAALDQLRSAAWEYVRTDYPDAPEAVQIGYVEQVMRGIQWLTRKWGENRPCPYCANTQWAVGVPLDVFRQAPGQTYGRLISAAHPVVCTNCGNTVLVSQSYAEQEGPEQ